MPFERDTLPQLIDRGAGEFETRLPGLLARLRNSVVSVINRVVAGGLSSLQKYAEYLSNQWWPDLAAPEFLPDHGARWAVNRLPAAPATGDVLFGGADGSLIAAGTLVQRSDGVQYATTADGEIAAGEASIPAQALFAGQLGNAVVGTSLTLTSPVVGVNAVATAETALAGGADVEGIEAWRARIMARIRKPPQGGADYDYIAWAKEVPGVTRAWVYPMEHGPGTVVVRFVRDGDASIIPDSGEVAAVQAHIDAVRPVTASTYVLAPVPTVQDFTIQLTPNTASVQAAVEAELRDLYRREAVPGGTMLLSHQNEAISIATGEIDHILVNPTIDQTYTPGQLPTLGTITWA
jgi:uncharacterized phage protein gp47/JayE